MPTDFVRTCPRCDLFCSPAPIDTGTYRSADGEDQRISAELPGALPFWFNDVTGDYLTFAGGTAHVDVQKIGVPLTFSTSAKARLRTWVAITFAAHQCVETAFGAVPEAPAK